MLCCASVTAKFLPENHGKRRENGVERTSATASTPASRSKVMKRSAGIFEWPMLNRSKDDIAETLAEKTGSLIAAGGWQMINRRCRARCLSSSDGATMLPHCRRGTSRGDCNAPVALRDCHRRMVFDFRALLP